MTQPNRRPGRKKPNRSGVALSCYIDAQLRKAMDQYIEEYNATAEHPASVRTTVEAALKLYLSQKGFWKTDDK